MGAISRSRSVRSAGGVTRPAHEDDGSGCSPGRSEPPRCTTPRQGSLCL
jgi:hypothetical protein